MRLHSHRADVVADVSEARVKPYREGLRGGCMRVGVRGEDCGRNPSWGALQTQVGVQSITHYCV